MKIISLEPLAVPTVPVEGYARRWRTEAPVTCIWAERSKNRRTPQTQMRRYTVPAGYETDGPSIPLLVRGLVSNVEWAASVQHDHEYEHRDRSLPILASLREKWRVDLRFRSRLAYTRREWGLSRTQRALYAIKHDAVIWPAVVIGGVKAWLD